MGLSRNGRYLQLAILVVKKKQKQIIWCPIFRQTHIQWSLQYVTVIAMVNDNRLQMEFIMIFRGIVFISTVFVWFSVWELL
jgi:hypothetical protein